MKLYDPAEICSKCGGDVEPSYVESITVTNPYCPYLIISPERLRCTCKRCGYVFFRKPLDAEVKEDA